jgi:hypothetical protein
LTDDKRTEVGYRVGKRDKQERSEL